VHSCPSYQFWPFKFYGIFAQKLINFKKMNFQLTLNLIYALIISALIFLGLSSRAYTGCCDAWIHLYVGDVLYTTMYYFLFRWFWSNLSMWKAAFWAILLCYAIEFLQLYQEPWMEAIRNTRLGGLILGFGFLGSDFVCYAIGGVLGVFIEKVVNFFKKK
jgi:Protein of unknown function (DUF2809)